MSLSARDQDQEHKGDQHSYIFISPLHTCTLFSELVLAHTNTGWLKLKLPLISRMAAATTHEKHAVTLPVRVVVVSPLH